MKKSYLLGMILLVLSCSPKVKQTVKSEIGSLRDTEEVVVFPKMDSTVLKKGAVLGDVVVKDGGLTVVCDLRTVMELAKSQARLMGANALMIYEHKLPNVLTSSCHRIKAKAIRIEEISEFEQEITWHKDRKLKISDFKADTTRRPFQAATYSSFSYWMYSPSLVKKSIFTVKTTFHCNDSYFKSDDDSSFVLAHEQLHFDITEFYARLLVTRVKQTNIRSESVRTQIEEISNKIVSERQKENDHYDSEVYNDPAKQSYWNRKIARKLDSLSAFESKRIEIKIRLK